eukprot:gi/632957123/ref/XP_007894303.1/ PREDICTED: PIH1 domain-containing protein 2 isoform X1 [Callorhinchus milii]
MATGTSGGRGGHGDGANRRRTGTRPELNVEKRLRCLKPIATMETKPSGNAMLQQANQLWDLLDGLSEDSPEVYQKFIQHQLQEGIKQFTPPDPHTCFLTRILEPHEKLLYVNLCKWTRIPVPESDCNPIPLGGGKLEEIVEGTDIYSVTDIAYNPDVLKRGSKDPAEMDQLVLLAIKYIEEQFRVRLSYSYTTLPATLKGSIQKMKERLTGISAATQSGEGIATGSVDSLLKQLTRLSVGNTKCKENPDPIQLLTDISQPKKPGLIEEISSTERDSGGNQLATPEYEMSLIKDESGKPRALQLSVELPRLSSIVECDLSVSEDDLVIDVPGIYKLELNLQVAVNQDSVSAKFSKRTHILSVMMAIK